MLIHNRSGEGGDEGEGSHGSLRGRSSHTLHLEISTNGSTKSEISLFCSKERALSTFGQGRPLARH